MTATPLRSVGPAAYQQASPQLRNDAELRDTAEFPAGMDRDLLVASLQGHLADLRNTLDSAAALMSRLGEPPAMAAAAIHRFASRHVPRWHFPMLNDEQRNQAFASALRQITIKHGFESLNPAACVPGFAGA